MKDKDEGVGLKKTRKEWILGKRVDVIILMDVLSGLLYA